MAVNSTLPIGDLLSSGRLCQPNTSRWCRLSLWKSTSPPRCKVGLSSRKAPSEAARVVRPAVLGILCEDIFRFELIEAGRCRGLMAWGTIQALYVTLVRNYSLPTDPDLRISSY